MPSIGIDLGTTNSCVAFVRDGKADAIANPNGKRTTPSHVAYSNERLVGDEAKHQKAENRKNTIYDTKRLIGRKFAEATVQEDLKKWAFEVVNDDEKVKVKVFYKDHERLYCPEEISSAVLSYMKTTAEEFLGKNVYSAVITVPAHFTDAQRRATRDAAEIAELHVLGMINEPTAAALAYGLENRSTKKRNVLIYDLGGGTFDVTIMSIEDQIYRVLATGGDAHLGGEDFNERLLTHLKSEFEKKRPSKTIDYTIEHRLRQKCEKTKRLLSTQMRVNVYVESLGGEDFKLNVTRATFEKLCEDLFRATMVTMEKVLEDANLHEKEIDEVVLVGGSTRIPYIQKELKEYFDDNRICKTINPDEAVALGSALHAAFLSGDVAGEMSTMTLHDVLPFSLGIEVDGGKMAVIVKRNTEIPTQEYETLTTVADNQTSIEYPVYEGENDMVSENNLLGTFTLSGLPALPAGKVKTKVCFNIDASGVLAITACDLSNDGNEETITISWDEGRMSEQELENMKNEMQTFREEGNLKQKILTARNDMEVLINKHQAIAKERRHGTISFRHVRLKSLCDDASEWMDENPDATLDNLKQKHKELKETFRPFE